MSEAEPLTDAELVTIARQLRDLAATLQGQLAGDSRTDVVDLDQSAVGRVSRVDALQAQQMAQAEQRRNELRLQQVQQALAFLDEGSFGDCRRCGEPIGYRRLFARPETPFCVRCATSLGA